MRFVADGPDIPDAVRRALEDEELVLFCGAGVSMSTGPGVAGMPSFSQLVNSVTGALRQVLNDQEQAALTGYQYDRALHLLEQRLGRNRVRQAVVDVLTVTAPFERHKAVLELARLRDGGFRMVTTNFDPQFDHAAKALGYEVTNDVAPMLPVPKQHRWRSVAYLHGKIAPGATGEHTSVQSLVYSTGDFGLAYLTERWASRFVTDLFTKYPVLFVGYSVDDPVMRYLMDAFAAERQLAGSSAKPSPRAWAFAPYQDPTAMAQDEEAWRAKGVEPIPYAAPNHDHSLLYDTLAEWGQRKKFGLTARIRAAERASDIIPVPPYSVDHEVEAVRWALEEPAAVLSFAKAEVPAPIQWLPVLEEWQLLGVRASLPATGASVSQTAQDVAARWVSPTHFQLMVWLTRHLDKPELLDWVLKGGSPHPALQTAILDRLDEPAAAPGAVAKPNEKPHLDTGLEAAWRLVAHPMARAPMADLADVHACWTRLKGGADDHVTRQDFTRMMAPIPRIKRTHPFFEPSVSPPGGTASFRLPTAGDHVAIDIELACGDMLESLLEAVRGRTAFLAAVADDLTSQLKRALDLFALVGQAGETSDPLPVMYRPVRPGPEARGYEDWTRLIDVTRDSMEALRETNAQAADALLLRWRALPYVLFQRMALDAYAV